ncbi:MAG TPA: bifunctional diguanylate cyclase/phosphodiesterase [Steroidobacteraceae bacterium]|nr:bifunctional diguanylate cyclase/phosphodiesterase [Steroidobacteraceae bacterium]
MPRPHESQANPWDSLDPYAQLIRSLLPRAANVAVFDGEGKLRWSLDTVDGPDLGDLVDDTLYAARTDSTCEGQLRLLGGDVPVYVCWLRDEASRLLALVAIPFRRSANGARSEPNGFAFVYALIRPALECLKRDLLARASIASLNDAVTELDRDLELLLADAAHIGGPQGGSDELAAIVQGTAEHLKCAMAALIVPDKGIAVLRARRGLEPNGQLLSRTHRQLLSMAQMRSEPMIINRVVASATVGVVPYRILCCPVRQASGRTMGALALFREQEGEELTARDARLAEVIARRAAAIIESQYDALSGLGTRAALERRAAAILAERPGGCAWSVLYVDVDQLHVVNDRFGMHVGDTVISRLGELVRKRLPPGALAARIAGDRFAALLPMEAEAAEPFAETLRASAELLGVADADARVPISISIGVARLERGARDLSHALTAAETACRAAKDRGRNRVALYETNDTGIVRRFADVNVAARLRDAIATERLRLDAQLVLPFAGGHGKPPHFELLLRMIGEDGATIGPDSFLSAANRCQLMPAIDRWVVERAIALLRPHAGILQERPAVFALNISGQTLGDDEFADFLIGAIESSTLNPAILCFELTESATILNITRAERLMRRLRNLGCGVALDDFGVGLSSLGYLRQLPVTLLKIDGSFTRDILRDTRSEFMVKAIAQLAASMQLATVAEYVETEEIRGRVATLGVDYGQGFAIGRPEPFADALAQVPLWATAAPAYHPAEAERPSAAPQLQ